MLFGRLNIKSLVVIGVISVICVIFMVAIFSSNGPQMIVTQAQNEAMRVARIAAADIDGDVFASIEEKGSPEYNAVYDALAKYRNYEGIKYIYSLKRIKGRDIVFVVDTDEVAPADIFEPYEWFPGMGPAFDGKVSANEEFVVDEWSTFLGGYAPIYDSKNRVVGIVGCDINIATTNEWLQRLGVIIVILAIIPNAIMVLMLGDKKSKKKDDN